MNTIDKWAEKIYSETDFGKSIATSIAGAVGLGVYLYTDDWIVSVFTIMITFPIFKILSTLIHRKIASQAARLSKKEESQILYDGLSSKELDVIDAFIQSGGTVLTFSYVNSLPISSSAIETLIQRGVVWTSMTADGMTETFALDTAIFDIANKCQPPNKSFK